MVAGIEDVGVADTDDDVELLEDDDVVLMTLVDVLLNDEVLLKLELELL